MKCAEAARIEAALRDIPDGTLEILPRGGSAIDARTDGRGRMETVAVFPGVEAAFTAFLGAGVELRHEPRVSVLEVYHCRCGRVGWNMPDGTAIYLGAGDLSLHGMARCAVSSMVFPLGYSEGLSLAVDLDALSSGARTSCATPASGHARCAKSCWTAARLRFRPARPSRASLSRSMPRRPRCARHG